MKRWYQGKPARKNALYEPTQWVLLATFLFIFAISKGIIWLVYDVS